MCGMATPFRVPSLNPLARLRLAIAAFGVLRLVAAFQP
jgi:hypothetical protein